MAVLIAKIEAATAPGRRDGDPTATAGEPSVKDKAQIRRAQVRKAQVQHRQRKTNYIKQLELDVVKMREMIAEIDRETSVLRRANEAMRARLKQQQQLRMQIEPQPETWAQGDAMQIEPNPTEELFGGINVDELTVTLGMDEVVGTPCFRISTSPSSHSTTSPAISGPGEGVQLSREQEDMVINFILS